MTTGGTHMRHTTLFLCGDVMTGRGIDQVLPHPEEPTLYEPFMRSALGYVDLAQRANGPIPAPVGFDYVWGDVLGELDRRRPDFRIANLETSVTTAEEPAPKGINYRMHPENVGVLSAARIDCCVLANNHVLDWGTEGLRETLVTLEHARIASAGAGRTAEEAHAPAVLDSSPGGRVLVFGIAVASGGVPPSWAADDGRPGVWYLEEPSAGAAERVAEHVITARQPGDIAVVSVHWGGNWGYEVPREQREFAHALIDSGAVDIVHGHSSHHPKGFEFYRDRLVLYGCGDFINDYEGISGYEEYRPDITLAYLPRFDSSGRLAELRMVPFRLRRFRLERASCQDAQWLADVLQRRSTSATLEVLGDGELRATAT